MQSYGYGLGGLIPLEEMFPLDCVDKPKSVRCRYCKTEGHEISNCPKLLKKKSNDESGLNHLFIGSIESDVTYTDRNVFNLDTGNFVNVLADSGASMHVWPSDRDSTVLKTAKMANGTSCDINDIRDVFIMDELGTKICLKNGHSVKGVNKHIISINALRKYGWRLIENTNFEFTHLVKDHCRITFIEKENNLHYIKATEVSIGVNNIAIQTPGDLPTGLTKEDDENENLAENINDEDKNKYKRKKRV